MRWGGGGRRAAKDRCVFRGRRWRPTRPPDGPPFLSLSLRDLFVSSSSSSSALLPRCAFPAAGGSGALRTREQLARVLPQHRLPVPTQHRPGAFGLLDGLRVGFAAPGCRASALLDVEQPCLVIYLRGVIKRLGALKRSTRGGYISHHLSIRRVPYVARRAPGHLEIRE